MIKIDYQPFPHFLTAHAIRAEIIFPSPSPSPFLFPSADRPVPPTITEVSSPTSTSVQVIWSITSNLNLIRSFIIEIRPSGEGENSWTQIERNPNAVTIQVIDENISPFTSYDVRVGALYISESVPVTGEAVTVVTMEDLPAGPPKEVVVTEVSSSETDLEVKWQVCMLCWILGEVILLCIHTCTVSFCFNERMSTHDFIVRLSKRIDVKDSPNLPSFLSLSLSFSFSLSPSLPLSLLSLPPSLMDSSLVTPSFSVSRRAQQLPTSP